ncbi:MAG: DNA-3-methyladenine glycosylase [Planctomycetes bacterium]|nr:DNA-3-methyladenine glycosylase [Planctomycetota bacterium]
MPCRLPRSFFSRPTLEVARGLLGARLVRVLDRERLSGTVVEVEAYIGQDDTACHASRGLTPRNAVMFGPPSFAYVYFTYGMHWMLNVVTEAEGFPAAVLIRALEPSEGSGLMRRLRGGRSDRELASGPARLCEALAIDGALNGTDMVRGDDLFFERGPPVAEGVVLRTPRIGIDYARRRDRVAPWRLVVAGSPFATRRR